MTAPTTQATRAKQRSKARDLVRQGLSNRTVAKRVGVSETTVRRWRRDDAPADAPVTHPAAPPSASPGASDDALTIELDDELQYHLGLLAEAGHTAADAISKAVAFLSNGYAYAWDYGVTERGVVPDLRIQVRDDPWPPFPWPPAKPRT